jgi:hypothetical protein
MAIDTTTPRSRRALLLGALGGLAASAAAFARPASIRAGVDGDVVLDATNAATGTTEIDGDGADPVLQVANETGVGVLGGSGDVSFPDPINASTGVYGISVAGVGVYGASDTGHGIYAANNSATKAAIAAEGDPGTAIHGHAGPGPVPTFPVSSAILATASGQRHGIQTYVEQGFALQALSTESLAILASGDADGIAGASSGDRTGVVGWSANQAPPAVPPAGPAKTGVYGEATQDANARGVFGKSVLGQGVRGEAVQGTGVAGESSSGTGVAGRGGIGVVGVGGVAAPPSPPVGTGVQGFGGVGVYGSSTAATGVFGKAGAGTTQVYAHTGVHGFAAETAFSQGVFGETGPGMGVLGKATSGQGVRGEATTGVGVKALATTGAALDVAGRAVFSRSGKALVPKNATLVDVTVPGGLAGSPTVLATLQIRRGSVHVLAARPNYPSAGKVRIYLSGVASTTVSTPVAWWVLG